VKEVAKFPTYRGYPVYRCLNCGFKEIDKSRIQSMTPLQLAFKDPCSPGVHRMHTCSDDEVGIFEYSGISLVADGIHPPVQWTTIGFSIEV